MTWGIYEQLHWEANLYLCPHRFCDGKHVNIGDARVLMCCALMGQLSCNRFVEEPCNGLIRCPRAVVRGQQDILRWIVPLLSADMILVGFSLPCCWRRSIVLASWCLLPRVWVTSVRLRVSRVCWKRGNRNGRVKVNSSVVEKDTDLTYLVFLKQAFITGCHGHYSFTPPLLAICLLRGSASPPPSRDREPYCHRGIDQAARLRPRKNTYVK
jgi:hypothetical protein